MFLVERANQVGGTIFVDALQYIVGATNVVFYKPGTIQTSFARIVNSIPKADIISINGEPLT